MTIKAIVAATDGSEESLRAVEWAAAEALLRTVPLRIVSAMSLLPWTIPLQLRPDRDRIADLIRSEREQALKTAAARAAGRAPGLVIAADPLGGPPAQTIARIGSSASMLVVGSRGIGAFTAMTLGSVSRYVAAHAGCPVVVVRDQAAAPHGQVIVGVGDPDDCAGALAFGFEEADLRDASLLAVHAWQAPGPMPADACVGLAEVLRTWQEKYPGVPAGQEVLPGHAARVLVGLSARADLMVIGRRARHARHADLPGPGSVRHAVLSHAHGPVVIVPSS
jgi:nucleotide-binding universal stress UspA family protein